MHRLPASGPLFRFKTSMARATMDMVIFSVEPATRSLSSLWTSARRPPKRSVVLSPTSGIAEVLLDVGEALAAAPFAWVMAKGPAVAVVQRVMADHLSLRLSGAIFFQPSAWIGAGGRLDLGLAPLSCPSVVVGDCNPASATAEHVLAWGSSWVPRLSPGQLQATPAIRDMVFLRSAALRDGLHP